MLTPPKAVSTKSDAHQELADAAKKILAATIPGADPFTQSWLINAAKTFVVAESRAGEARFSGPGAQKNIAVTKTTPIKSDNADAAESKTIGLSNAAKQAAVAKAMEEVNSPKPRPDWLVNPPKFSGEVRRYVVSVGPYVTRAECEQALAQQMREIVQTRLRDAVASYSGLREGEWSYNPHIDAVGMSDAQIFREFVADEYFEKYDASVGEMLKAHALLQFGAKQDQLLVDYWKRWMRRGRVESVVILSSFAVMGLAFVFGLLKIDTWTRGYYTKRLFFGVPAAIIGLFFLAMLILDS
jgi:hypothetical protein